MSKVHYLEIVTTDVDRMRKLYEAVHGLDFGEPQAAMGNAVVATRDDGSMVGIRAPMADHEAPIIRTYLAVDDIEEAAASAEELGAMIAYPPTEQAPFGTFAILIDGDLQHGLWQP